MLKLRWYKVFFIFLLFPISLFGAGSQAGSQVERILETAQLHLLKKVFKTTEEVEKKFYESLNVQLVFQNQAVKEQVRSQAASIISDVLLEQKYRTEAAANDALGRKKKEVVKEFKSALGSENKRVILNASLELLNEQFLHELLVDYGAAFTGPIKRALLICDNLGKILLHDFIVNRDRYTVVNCNLEHFEIGIYSQFVANYDELGTVQDAFCRALQVLLGVEPAQVNVPIQGDRTVVAFGNTPLHLALKIQNSRFRQCVINLLLSHGANPDLKNDECPQSPREFARLHNLENLFVEYDDKQIVKKSEEVQIHKKAEEKRRQERRFQWGEFAEQLKAQALRRKLGDLKQKKYLHAQERDELGAELLHIHRFGFEEREAIERNTKRIELERLNQQMLACLNLEHLEDVRRIKLEKALNERYLLFYTGQKSRDVEVEQLRQRISEFQAMSPQKKSISLPTSQASSVRSSMQSVDLQNGAVISSLSLTPRGQSKVVYTLGADAMAKTPQRVQLDDVVITKLNQLNEGNPWVSPLVFTQAIPCDPRVESMRATIIAVQKGTLEQLSADNYKLFDHSMTTDFIRKVIQYGSVYGQLRKNKEGVWVFNVLLVASICEVDYTGQFEPLMEKRIKKWVTLGFEVGVTQTPSIRFGNIYHFCVQETHPRFVLDEQSQMKFFLAPLVGVSGFIESQVLRLKCDGDSLRGCKRFLDRIKDVYFLENMDDDRAECEQYKNLWKPIDLSSPVKE